MTEANYREVSCNKNVIGDSFAQGVQDFNWSCGAPSVWIPRKSYIRVTMKVTGLGGRVLTTADACALADDACGGLYNNCSIKMGGQDISSINNYIQQASMLKNRFGRSGAWMQTVGRSSAFLEADLAKRISRLAVDTPLDVSPRPTILSIKSLYTNAGDAAPTVAIANNDGVVTGVATQFETILAPYIVGGLVSNVILYLNNKPYHVNTVTGELGLTLVEKPAAVGASSNAYFVVNVPYAADNKNIIDVCWQPPLGVFDLVDEKKGGADEVLQGDFRLSLNPNSNYKLACLETTKKAAADGANLPGASVVPGQGFLNLEILDVKFYMAYAKMYIQPSLVRTLGMAELMVLSKPLYKNNSYQFNVPSSTQAIAVWVQSGTSGTNCNYPGGKFKLLNNKQNSLSSFQLTYANVSKPATKWVSEYKDGVTGTPATGGINGINRLIQRYRDNLSESGLLMNIGGAETIEEYLERGLFILYTFTKDKNDVSSTQVELSMDFAEDVENQSNVFIAAVYDRAVEITTQEGAVVNVRTIN